MMLRLWRQYQDGILPEIGGSMDQSAVMMEAFYIMDSKEAKILQEQQRNKHA